MGFSVGDSEPFLGWNRIIEFKLVTGIPMESTEKLKDRNKSRYKLLSREPKILERRL